MNKGKDLYIDHIERKKNKDIFHRSMAVFEFATSWRDGLANLAPVLPSRIEANKLRLVLLLLLLLLFGLVVIGRLYFIQLVRGREFYVLSEQNRVFIKTVYPERGVIYDRNGIVLARNTPTFSVGLVFSELDKENIEEIRTKLNSTFGVTDSEIETAFEYARENPFNQVLLKRNVSHEQKIAYEAVKDELSGIYVTHDTVRSYPLKDLTAAVLGYTGAISSHELPTSDLRFYSQGSYIGKTGIEKQYESVLRGKLGRSLIEIEASGKIRRETPMEAPESGRDIYITLDLELQRKVQEFLNAGITQYNAWGGSALVVGLDSGEILSMVSLPTYDNNIFNTLDNQKIQQVLDDPHSLLLNKTVSGLYAPGSTVKMAVGAIALQEGVINPSSRISGTPQVIKVGAWEFPDWTYSWGVGAHGLMNISEAIANSSDIFFYKIGGGYPPECKMQEGINCQISGLGVDGVVQGLKLFGFGQKTGIDIPNESVGLVPDPDWKKVNRQEAWFLGNTYHLSIGQGDLLATPIQVVNLSNIIASDVKSAHLHLVKNPELVTAYALDERQEKPVSQEILSVIRDGMIQAVTEGIVYSLRDAKVSVAAKTGTAEFGSLNSEGEYETHAWVTGFAPVENPQIAFVFMLEAGGRSSNAAELARSFIDWYFGEFKKS